MFEKLLRKHSTKLGIALRDAAWARVKRGELKGRRQKGFIHSTKKIADFLRPVVGCQLSVVLSVVDILRTKRRGFFVRLLLGCLSQSFGDPAIL
jgi:hypothetical protein